MANLVRRALVSWCAETRTYLDPYEGAGKRCAFTGCERIPRKRIVYISDRCLAGCSFFSREEARLHKVNGEECFDG